MNVDVGTEETYSLPGISLFGAAMTKAPIYLAAPRTTVTVIYTQSQVQYTFGMCRRGAVWVAYIVMSTSNVLLSLTMLQ